MAPPNDATASGMTSSPFTPRERRLLQRLNHHWRRAAGLSESFSIGALVDVLAALGYARGPVEAFVETFATPAKFSNGDRRARLDVMRRAQRRPGAVSSAAEEVLEAAVAFSDARAKLVAWAEREGVDLAAEDEKLARELRGGEAS